MQHASLLFIIVILLYLIAATMPDPLHGQYFLVTGAKCTSNGACYQYGRTYHCNSAFTCAQEEYKILVEYNTTITWIILVPF